MDSSSSSSSGSSGLDFPESPTGGGGGSVVLSILLSLVFLAVAYKLFTYALGGGTFRLPAGLRGFNFKSNGLHAAMTALPKYAYVPFDRATPGSVAKDIVVVDCTHPDAPTLSHHKGHNNPHGMRVSPTLAFLLGC